jgi:integral membrane protein (TIGR01906 family)
MLRTTLRLFITITVPLLLVMGAARLVMFPLYLQLEYQRPGFPVDTYGFTVEDRLRYAPLAIDYLLNGEDVGFLEALTFPDGAPLYNERELIHMHDVKLVITAAFATALTLGVLSFIAGIILWRTARLELYRALFDGAALTIGLIVGIIALAVLSWDFFFTQFHNLFFADGTWIFLYSDTLIRLFPEQFWFDTAVVIGAMAVSGAALLIALTWRARFALNVLTPQPQRANL